MADDEVTPQAGELTTTNYGWIKPTVGASDDAWGVYINGDLDGIDATVKGIDTAKLNLTGGAVTGSTSFAAGISFGSGTVTGIDLTKHISLFGTTYGINVSSGQINVIAGNTSSVHFTPTGINTSAIGASVPSTGAFTTLSASGTVSGTGFTNLLSPYALTTSVPVASSTTPAMNGAAAVGTGTTWARADHVHPTDTTKYDASNPSGYQTAAQVTAVVPVASSTTPLVDGTAAVGAGTTWARADHVHPTDTSGRLGDNRIINGNFAFNQRTFVSGTALPSSPTVANGYGHDRWKAGANGCTYTFTAAVPDTTITITANTLTQIIEAGMIEGGVYTLSWTGTAQARVYQGAPTGSYAASPLITASLTAGTNTIVEFNVGTLTKVKFEIGSVATPYNRQSLAIVQSDCHRYYQSMSNVLVGGYNAASQLVYAGYVIPTMRTSPTVAFVSPSYVNASNLTLTVASVKGFGVQATATATGSATAVYSVTLTAEL